MGKLWSSPTKRLVVIGIAVLFVLAVIPFSQALAPLLVEETQPGQEATEPSDAPSRKIA